MEEDLVKQGFQKAKEELRQEQIKHVKEIAKRTLKKIDLITKERDEANSKLAILKKDIQDLKEGRLDRIEERQKKDPLALKTSVAMIVKEPRESVKEAHHHYYDDRWYWPYRITWMPQLPYYDSMGTIVTNTSGIELQTTGIQSDAFTLNCSVAKDYTAGTYVLSSGDTKYIT